MEKSLIREDGRDDDTVLGKGWSVALSEAAAGFTRATPYPHIVLDGFLRPEVADRCAREFPPIDTSEWISYTHVNERKFGCYDRRLFPREIKAVVDQLNSPRFVRWLEELTGIDGLLPDPQLMGAGLHQSVRGGYLNVHADFTGHQHRPSWRRRINVLVYFNPGWQDDYGGHLELWANDMSACQERIAPLHNRAVIFRTDLESHHGHPEPLTCPEGETRKSLALYYFTEEERSFHARATSYRARPGDGTRAVLIYLDTLALRCYDVIKRRFKLSDRFASRLLSRLFRR